MTAENALILNSALILFLPPAEQNISLTASIATETAISKIKNRIRRKATHSNILATIKLIFTKITIIKQTPLGTRFWPLYRDGLC